MLSQQKVQCSPVTVWVVSGLSGFIPSYVRLIGGFGHISFCVRTWVSMKLNVLFEYNFYSLFCLYFHIQATDLVVDSFLGVQTVNQVKANLDCITPFTSSTISRSWVKAAIRPNHSFSTGWMALGFDIKHPIEMLIRGQYDEIWPIKQARVLNQDLYTTPTFLTEPPRAPWTGLASFHILTSHLEGCQPCPSHGPVKLD